MYHPPDVLNCMTDIGTYDPWITVTSSTCDAVMKEDHWNEEV